MHLHDQIAPVGCAKQGFPYIYPVIDHCFVGMHMGTRTPNLMTDPGIALSSSVESKLFGGDFESWATQTGINSNVLNRKAGCHCSPASGVGQTMSCSSSDSSPIRSWLVE